MFVSDLVSRIGRSAMFRLDPEKAHEVSIKGLKSGLIPVPAMKPDPRLAVKLGDLVFPTPLGLAAGFDKNAEVPDEILRLGFGFTEVGTITPRAQPGNPKPRVFRLVKDQGVINRLGFNNEGHAEALKRLQNRSDHSGIVGVNIGANKGSEDFVADYEAGIECFYEVASYFTANISSPNTPGLRNLQAGEALKVLLDRIFDRLIQCELRHGGQVPVFLKIAPDLDEAAMDEIAEVVNGSNLAGLIVSNTTLDRDGLKDNLRAKEAGGLSGRPLFKKSTIVLAKMRQRVKTSIPLIGVGGIFSAEDVLAKMEAGASLVQVYTGLIYGGPSLPAKITKGLSNHLDANGMTSITGLVGTKTVEWAER